MSTKRIKGFEIEPVPIGIGLYSYIYQAFDHNQHKYAVKKLSNLKMAKHEANVMKEYGKHPYLPLFYDYFVIDNKAYIVMEYFSGGNLGIDGFNVQVKKGYKEDAIVLTLKILKGLKHLHQIGFLHNDIKPKNILVERDLTIKIVDFGLSVSINQQNANNKWKNRDLYDSALMCIYIINGYVSEKPVNDLESIDNDLKSVLYVAINPNKSKQYNSAKDFIIALESLS